MKNPARSRELAAVNRSCRSDPPEVLRSALRRAIVLAALVTAAACGDPPATAPPARDALRPEQHAILETLNRLGAEEVAGRSHAYGFRAPCSLVVVERLDGRPKAEADLPLKGVELEVLEYVGDRGFGLKGSVPGRPGTADLFESRHEAVAQQAGELIARLAATCT
jgi:hypothetical protein